jgi:hypothetical protein
MPILLTGLERALVIAVPIAAGALIWRLWRQRLAQRYRYFTVYLLYILATPCIVPFLDRDSYTYFLTFAGIETVGWVLQMFVVFELFALLFRKYPGVGAAGRDFMKIAFALAVLITLFLAVLNHQSGPGKHPAVETFFLVSRVVTSLILAFIALMIGFLMWFPLPLNRNTWSYLCGYSVYFLGLGITQFAGNMLGPDAYRWLSAVEFLIAFACLLFWNLVLTRSGEESALTVSRRWDPADENRLLRQLESINASLVRARK